MHYRDEIVLLIAGVLIGGCLIIWGYLLLYWLKERKRDIFVQRVARLRKRQEDEGYESNEEEEEKLRELGAQLGFAYYML
ncbi:vpu protein [Simian immunodeficiency virus]|uniref:Protein Vpu n=1 Tax=Simian immunodeficiency virus TaxID=11723 RepID=A0A0D4CHM3_SIV|nr:vpu protein [Simian immunodeficiency virus]